MKILVDSTPISLWHDIIHEAEGSCAVRLQEDVESYLVFLLDRYTNRPELVKQIIATNFLKGINLTRNKRELALREVGDQCLIFSGLFPQVAEKRLVKISYFVNVGIVAYDTISTKRSDIYHSLSHQFVGLMDILQSVRKVSQQFPDLLPMQAYDLWNETGSKRALAVLSQYTSGTPVKGK